VRGRRIALESHFELELLFTERADPPAPEPAAELADGELVARLRAQDLAHVAQPAVAHAHAARLELVGVVEQENVQRARV